MLRVASSDGLDESWCPGTLMLYLYGEGPSSTSHWHTQMTEWALVTFAFFYSKQYSDKGESEGTQGPWVNDQFESTGSKDCNRGSVTVILANNRYWELMNNLPLGVQEVLTWESNNRCSKGTPKKGTGQESVVMGPPVDTNDSRNLRNRALGGVVEQLGWSCCSSQT